MYMQHNLLCDFSFHFQISCVVSSIFHILFYFIFHFRFPSASYTLFITCFAFSRISTQSGSPSEQTKRPSNGGVHKMALKITHPKEECRGSERKGGWKQGEGKRGRKRGSSNKPLLYIIKTEGKSINYVHILLKYENEIIEHKRE